MITKEFNAFIRAPIEQVWAAATDYEGYARIPGVKAASIVKEGKPTRQGLGAVRRIVAMGVTFDEEITHFEVPTRLRYKIVKSSPIPLVHEGGDMQFSAGDGGTQLHWTTTFTVGWPLIGNVLAVPLGWVLKRKFDQMLEWLKRDIELRAGSGAAAAPARR